MACVFWAYQWLSLALALDAGNGLASLKTGSPYRHRYWCQQCDHRPNLCSSSNTQAPNLSQVLIYLIWVKPNCISFTSRLFRGICLRTVSFVVVVTLSSVYVVVVVATHNFISCIPRSEWDRWFYLIRRREGKKQPKAVLGIRTCLHGGCTYCSCMYIISLFIASATEKRLSEIKCYWGLIFFS